MMKIRGWYHKAFPTDDMWEDIDARATFAGLWDAVKAGKAYEYIGAADSLIRERLFAKLADNLGVEYSVVYDAWLEA